MFLQPVSLTSCIKFTDSKCDYLHLSELKLTGQFRRNLTKISQYQLMIDEHDRKHLFKNPIITTSFGINFAKYPENVVNLVCSFLSHLPAFDKFALKQLTVLLNHSNFPAFSVKLPKSHYWSVAFASFIQS